MQDRAETFANYDTIIQNFNSSVLNAITEVHDSNQLQFYTQINVLNVGCVQCKFLKAQKHIQEY